MPTRIHTLEEQNEYFRKKKAKMMEEIWDGFDPTPLPEDLKGSQEWFDKMIKNVQKHYKREMERIDYILNPMPRRPASWDSESSSKSSSDSRDDGPSYTVRDNFNGGIL